MKGMSARRCMLTGTLAVALLCAAAVSFAQQEPQPAAPAPATPAAAAQSPKAAAPVKATPPARKRTRPRPGAAPPHTNVETTGGLEQRAARTHKPAAATASPTTEPPK